MSHARAASENKQRMTTPEQWHEVAQQMRVDSIRSTTAAGSGHPTSSMSAADLMAVLLCKYLRYDFGDPKNPNNDYLIFSKGHASPLLYAMYKAAGVVSEKELLTLRTRGSRLQGHPAPVLPWVEVATGSLGQGVPISVGIATAAKYLEHREFKIWVLLGDSEMAEGSNWEGFEHAAFHSFARIVAILDMNRLGQVTQTMLGWDGEVYAERARAFGWRTIIVDGHDYRQIDSAYTEAANGTDQPTLIIARTIKAKGFSEIENKNGWHGKALPKEMATRAISELGGIRNIVVDVAKPPVQPSSRLGSSQNTEQPLELPKYQVGSEVATRVAYGDALTALGQVRSDVIVLDADMGNSTFSETFAAAHPERFFQQYIAEQQMVATAVGLQARGFVPFASTFAAFFTRAYDFIRVAAISRANIRICGSHAGASIGQDGPSQMALEDLAMMRAVHDSTVLYSCDPNQTARLVAEMADREGIVYLRTTRESTPVIYSPDEQFPIGGCRVLRQSDSDQVTVVGGGVTVHEALKAADTLKGEGINVRVIDLYSIKPVDVETLRDAASATGGRIVTVEDHWREGGLGAAVLDAFAGTDEQQPAAHPPTVVKLAVHHMPDSATPEQEREEAGIDAASIVTAVKKLLGK